MIVSMLWKNMRYSLLLPEKVASKYYFYDNKNNKLDKIVSIEALDGEWYLKASDYSRIVVNDSEVEICKFEYGAMYSIKLSNDSSVCKLFSQTNEDNFYEFVKFKPEGNDKIHIGKGVDSTICFDNSLVSEEHAILLYQNNEWFIRDCGSENGTFLNNRMIEDDLAIELYPGDSVYIMGMVIIIGSNFFAINQINNLKIDNARLTELKVKQPQRRVVDFNTVALSYFHKLPRFKRSVIPYELRVDSPPKSQLGEDTPLWLLMGSSATMGFASLVTGSFSVFNAIAANNITSAIPSMAMSISMMVGTLVMPVLVKRYEKKRKIEKEEIRQQKYLNYIFKIRERINSESINQKNILTETALTAGKCALNINNNDKNLWNRSAENDDFLDFRIGTGNLPLQANIIIPEERFSLEDDNLNQVLDELRNQPKLIYQAPVTVSMKKDKIISVYGARNLCIYFANGIVSQCIAYYGHDIVKTVFIYDKFESNAFDYAKWLPHVWNDDKTLRFIASDNDELKEISLYLSYEAEMRKSLDEKARKKSKPYYLIFVFSKELFAKADFIKSILESEHDVNMSIMTFFDDFSDVPKDATSVVELNGENGRMFDKNDTTGKSISFVCDNYINRDLSDSCKKLLELNLDRGENYILPSVIPFLELFGVGKVEHLNLLEKWKTNDPTKSLRAEIGIDTHGDKFYLDLHENYHGPHGLVAGMTGSGKSEFIISYILSLAINYHPDEVSFVLIDYKGGGMAKSFENLPHVAGIITNLDGATLNRSLVSIQSELRRRQEIFTKSSKKLKMSNIDIYKYQKAYRDGIVNEPLSHVFIIADEFAELKTQQPEFMEQLISAARIGRSLGVHLILATQKPSGVVNDQIWSNSRFRVCLKVQEKADSMDMLKRADAAALKQTGRFYLQVGYNELFSMGQSAWSGATYHPVDSISENKDPEIKVVNMTGNVMSHIKMSRKTSYEDIPQKQLDVITDYIGRIAESENIKATPLSLAPLPMLLLLDTLEKKYAKKTEKSYELSAVVGEVDDPAHQKMFPLYIDFTALGNAIVYGISGSGKEDFITTVLFGLISTHTSQEFNAYIIDFGAEVLSPFLKAPHIGGIALSDEEEKIENLLKMLKNQMIIRKKLFSQYGGTLKDYCTESGKNSANILVVINNYTAFSEAYDRFADDILLLSREGTRYGIYFLLTCTGSTSVRFKLAQNFKQIFALQQNSQEDFYSIFGNTKGMYPTSAKGRGLIKLGECYEFQTTLPSEPALIKSTVKELCVKLSGNKTNVKAPRIPVLPDVVNMECFENIEINLSRIPYGIYKEDLSVATYDFTKTPFLCVSSAEKKLANSLALGITGCIVASEAVSMAWLFGDNTFVGSNIRKCNDYERDIVALFEEITGRHKLWKDNRSYHFNNLLVVITNFSDIYEQLSADGRDKLEVLISQSLENYAVAFIICDDVNSIKKYSASVWYKKAFGGKGLWIGQGASSQYLFKTSQYLRNDNVAGKDFGFDYLGGSYRAIKYISDEVSKDE